MQRLRGQNGFTLIGVMAVLTILSVLGLSIVTLTAGLKKISSGERHEQSAFYIAEAGLTYEMAQIEKYVAEEYEKTDRAVDFFDRLQEKIINKSEVSDFEESFGEQPKAIIITERIDGKSHYIRNYKITSTGVIGSKERTVRREFSVQWEEKDETEPYELPPLAVYTSGRITLTNGPVIGSIATTSKEKHPLVQVVEYKKFKKEIYMFLLLKPPMQIVLVELRL